MGVIKKMLRVVVLLLPALVAGFSLTPEQRLEVFKVKLVDQKEQRLEAFKVKLADLKEPKGWTDEYIDNILAIAQEIIRSEGLDPAPLPEEEVSLVTQSSGSPSTDRPRFITVSSLVCQQSIALETQTSRSMTQHWSSLPILEFLA